MPEFELVYEGRVREIYAVTAASEDEAREKWSDTEPVTSEVIDGGIVSVNEVED